MANIHEKCPCGGNISIDTGTGEKLDKSVMDALADWRAGHTHSHDSGAKAAPGVPTF